MTACCGVKGCNFPPAFVYLLCGARTRVRHVNGMDPEPATPMCLSCALYYVKYSVDAHERRIVPARWFGTRIAPDPRLGQGARPGGGDRV